MTDWTGKHVVVTGGASGIGAATLTLLKARGATVTVIDLNSPPDTADHWIKADLTDLGAITTVVLDHGIDALINAAGLPPRTGLEADILRVNYFALTRLTKHLLSLINDGGAIVNMASRAGAHWRENYAQVQRLNSISGDIELDDFVQREVIDPVRAYDLSKEAVILWTKEMVAPLRARGLRINAASPAAVDTPILGDFMTALGERAERGLVITGRAGRAEEIARTLVFLASPEASWITGCNIECDGGLTAELDLSALKKAHVG